MYHLIPRLPTVRAIPSASMGVLLTCLVTGALPQSAGGAEPCDCKTLVGGNIANQTWTKENSPYCVTNDVYVAGNLNIREGVEVCFQSNYVFEVAGRLRAVGTGEEPISFRPGTDAGWQGLLFADAVAGSFFIHTTIEGATRSAVRIRSSPPAFTNCWIKGNSNPEAGGGISISSPGSDVLLVSSKLSDNRSASTGGAVSVAAHGGNVTIRGCTFTGNTSGSHGGAVWTDVGTGKILLEDCNISNNQANPVRNLLNAEGGAVHFRGNATILNSTISNNRCYARCNGTFGCAASGYGGGIMLYGDTTVLNSSIVGNHIDSAELSGWSFSGEAYAYGSGIAVWAGTVTIRNALIAYNTLSLSGNSTYPRGGGLVVAGGPKVRAEVVNSTICYNDSWGVYNQDAQVVMSSSVAYYNNKDGKQIEGSVGVTYSDIQGCYAGVGNICLAPSLCPVTLSLLAGSPCIDAGDPGLEFRDGCIDNEEPCSPYARGGTRNDMGAYGGPGVCYWTEPRAEPVIRIQPDNLIGFEGQPVSLGVVATGAEPLLYTWKQDDFVKTGQTNSVLTIPIAAITDAGDYTVEVTNALGETNSVQVHLGIARYDAETEGLIQGRPRLLIRNGKTGEQCAIYSLSPLALGEILVVPGTGSGEWLLRDTLTFPTNEMRWTDPQALGVGEARFYGVVPVQ